MDFVFEPPVSWVDAAERVRTLMVDCKNLTKWVAFCLDVFHLLGVELDEEDLTFSEREVLIDQWLKLMLMSQKKSGGGDPGSGQAYAEHSRMNRYHPDAKCEECPLFGLESYVPSAGPKDAEIAIVGEGPRR